MISGVFVSYRSASLAERAIATFREEARRAGRKAEAIAVVNSGDGAERDVALVEWRSQQIGHVREPTPGG